MDEFLTELKDIVDRAHSGLTRLVEDCDEDDEVRKHWAWDKALALKSEAENLLASLEEEAEDAPAPDGTDPT